MSEYVVCLAFDAAHDSCVGIVKDHGPAPLVKRIYFPGGRIEFGETPALAATREMREETGLDVDCESWRCFAHKRLPEDLIYFMVADEVPVHRARQLTSEYVFAMDLKFHRTNAVRQPAAYADTFLAILAEAQSVFEAKAA